MDSAPDPAPQLKLSVIIPARNEEDCLGDCLRSLVSQSESVWQLGRDWEVLVIDDDSTDQTHAIATSFPEVTAMLALGWFIVLCMPNVHELTERGRTLALTAGFGLTMQALFFAPRVAPFLYFQF